jgi:hypothetical protein
VDIALGEIGWAVLGNVAYFVVMAAVGIVVASHRLNTLPVVLFKDYQPDVHSYEGW